MAEKNRVTRADLPQFTVASVEEGERDADGLIEWRLRGCLSRVEGLPLDGRLFVLLIGRRSLTGNFSQRAGERHEATFTTWDKGRPDIEGLSLACTDAYYVHQILTVEDGPEAWEGGMFAASGAIADNFIGTDGKSYRRLRKAGVNYGEAGEGPTSTVPGGWDHEHCSICWPHIDPGDRYFFHAGYNLYLCAECYPRYVLTGSIAFALPPEKERSNGEQTPPE